MEPSTSPDAALAALAREAHVWIAQPARFADAEVQASLLRLLSADERARLVRRRRESDRLTFLVARALVRNAIAHYVDAEPEVLRFEAGRFGQPRLAFPHVDGFRFSLTHTAGLAACAVARDCECGIDAEALDRRIAVERVAPRVLSESERRAWSAFPDHEQRAEFLKRWTLKEAYVKARGTGFQGDPRAVSFAVAPDAVHLVEAPDESDPASWTFVRLAPTNAHAVAVALRRSGHPSPTVVVREGWPATSTAAATGPREARRGG